MVLKSRTRQQGGSAIATLPAEVARRLALARVVERCRELFARLAQ